MCARTRQVPEGGGGAGRWPRVTALKVREIASDLHAKNGGEGIVKVPRISLNLLVLKTETAYIFNTGANGPNL